MELWDLYNEHRQLTGRDHIRGEEIPPGYFHLVVHVWIRNSNGKYLISQRSADRPMHPLKWECVGGSVLKGEDSLTGALRETKEEVGLTLNPKYGKIVRSTIGRVVNGVKFSDTVPVLRWRKSTGCAPSHFAASLPENFIFPAGKQRKSQSKP